MFELVATNAFAKYPVGAVITDEAEVARISADPALSHNVVRRVAAAVPAPAPALVPAPIPPPAPVAVEKADDKPADKATDKSAR